MCSQRERQRKTGDDYIPVNKSGMSAASMEMLSGMSVASGLGHFPGSLNGMEISVCMCV